MKRGRVNSSAGAPLPKYIKGEPQGQDQSGHAITPKLEPRPDADKGLDPAPPSQPEQTSEPGVRGHTSRAAASGLPKLPEKRWPSAKAFQAWMAGLNELDSVAQSSQTLVTTNAALWLPDDLLKLILERLSLADGQAWALTCQYNYGLLKDKGPLRLPQLIKPFLHGCKAAPSTRLVKCILDLLAPRAGVPDKDLQYAMRDRLRAVLLLAMAATSAGDQARKPDGVGNTSERDAVHAAVQNLGEKALIALEDLLDYHAQRQWLDPLDSEPQYLRLQNILWALTPILPTVSTDRAQAALLAAARRVLFFGCPSISVNVQAVKELIENNPSLHSLHALSCLALCGAVRIDYIAPEYAPSKLPVARALLADFTNHARLTQRLLQVGAAQNPVATPVWNATRARFRFADRVALLDTVLGLEYGDKCALITERVALLELELNNWLALAALRLRTGLYEADFFDRGPHLRVGLDRKETPVGVVEESHAVLLARRFGELAEQVIALHTTQLDALRTLQACATKWPEKYGGQVVRTWFREKAGAVLSQIEGSGQ